MGKVKLLSAMDKLMGKHIALTIATKKGNALNVSGELHKHNDQYWIVKDEEGKSKVVIEGRRGGSVWTWIGTHDEYTVRFIDAGKELAVFQISDSTGFDLK